MAKALSSKSRLIDLTKIDPPAGQVRLEIPSEGVQELADSLNAVGQLQPVLVRPVGDRFEIVFGHRRFLAAQHLRWPKIRADVKVLDDLAVALMRASENLPRADLSLIEEAAIYADLRDTHKLSIDEIGRRMGKSPGIVHRRLDLLKMPPQLQKAVHAKEISYGVAEDLWSLGDISAIDYYLGFAIEHGATVAVVRGWVKDWKDTKRREATEVAGGGGVRSPMEPRPVYVTCDLCSGPMELGSETVVRGCKPCIDAIRAAVAAAPK